MITINPIKLNTYKNISFKSTKNENNHSDLTSIATEGTNIQFKSIVPKESFFKLIANKFSKFVKEIASAGPTYDKFDIQDEIFRVLA